MSKLTKTAELRERMESLRAEAGCLDEVNHNARMREMLRGWYDTIVHAEQLEAENNRLREALETMGEVRGTLAKLCANPR